MGEELSLLNRYFKCISLISKKQGFPTCLAWDTWNEDLIPVMYCCRGETVGANKGSLWKTGRETLAGELSLHAIHRVSVEHQRLEHKEGGYSNLLSSEL